MDDKNRTAYDLVHNIRTPEMELADDNHTK